MNPELNKWQRMRTLLSPVKAYKKCFLVLVHPSCIFIAAFTDGSKVDEKVAAAAVSFVTTGSSSSCQQETIVLFTQLCCKQFYLLLSRHISLQKENFWSFFSDSLSALQALGKLKPDHPLPMQVQDMLQKTVWWPEGNCFYVGSWTCWHSGK